MKKQKNIKNYIISQWITYLTLGLVAGYFLGVNELFAFTLLLVVAGVVLSYWFRYWK